MKRTAATQAGGAFKKPRQAQQAVAQRQVPGGGGQRRAGYGGVQRAQGAAVVGEMKYYDANLTNTNLVATTGTWPAGTMLDPTGSINLGSAAVATPLSLFCPTVGAALNQRIGRKVKVLKIKVMGTLQTPAQATQATADQATSVRLLLVQDCQTNAAQMTAAQLINDADSATANLSAFQNPNNFGRFKVLKQKRFSLADPNMAGEVAAANIIQGSFKVNWKMNVNFKVPVEVHFNATNGGTVADIIDNSFHIVCACDSTALTPALNYYSRVCYKE